LKLIFDVINLKKYSISDYFILMINKKKINIFA